MRQVDVTANHGVFANYGFAPEYRRVAIDRDVILDCRMAFFALEVSAFG